MKVQALSIIEVFFLSYFFYELNGNGYVTMMDLHDSWEFNAVAGLQAKKVIRETSWGGRSQLVLTEEGKKLLALVKSQVFKVQLHAIWEDNVIRDWKQCFFLTEAAAHQYCRDSSLLAKVTFTRLETF
jgi:hypothetical protein